MRITAECHSCRNTLEVGAEHAGKKIRCPVCQGVVQLPQAPPRPKTPIKPQAGFLTPKAAEKKPVDEGGRKTARSRRRKKRREPDPDRIWEQPLASHGHAIPEELYEEYGIPSRSPNENQYEEFEQVHRQPLSGLGFTIWICGLCILVSLIGGAISRSHEEVGGGIVMTCAILSSMVGIASGLRILCNAWNEDAVCGFLYMFLPGYSLYYLISRWDENAAPFIAALISSFSGFACVLAGASLGMK